MEYDKLKLLAGDPYCVNDRISIVQPTLREIADYGEERYWQLVTTLSATSFDFRFQLDDMGFDYTDVDDFTMFAFVIQTLEPDDTRIIFPDIDLKSLVAYQGESGNYLADKENDIVIDDVIYQLIVQYLRDIHGLKRNYKTFGNKGTQKFYMEDERRRIEEEAKSGKNKFKSIFEPLISAMVNCCDFKYDYSTVWNLSLYQFMDAVKRTRKLSDYRNVMTGIYTGNIETKSIDKEILNWQGEL